MGNFAEHGEIFVCAHEYCKAIGMMQILYCMMQESIRYLREQRSIQLWGTATAANVNYKSENDSTLTIPANL